MNYKASLTPDQFVDFQKLHGIWVAGRGLTQCAARKLKDGTLEGYVTFNDKVVSHINIRDVQTQQLERIAIYEEIVDLVGWAEQEHGIELESMQPGRVGRTPDPEEEPSE